uniref:Uncharacterized protein n=1 Tax=Pipistrellus kuhlii TaxID=59472 RepID=A0A7J8A7I4_PIPKU|nr:hypothetical protein mPipKuh1_008848 [Pipistrellus kuhlii]
MQKAIDVSLSHLYFSLCLSPSFLLSLKINENMQKPVWLSGRASVCGLKGPRFDSCQGHVHWFAGTSPIGGVQEAAGRCFSLIDISSSLSLSHPPLCKISIKYIFLKINENISSGENQHQQQNVALRIR